MSYYIIRRPHGLALHGPSEPDADEFVRGPYIDGDDAVAEMNKLQSGEGVIRSLAIGVAAAALVVLGAL